MIEIDELIVQQAAQGDNAALSDILCRCYPAVCRICVALTGDTQRGLTLVSELVRQSITACERWQDGAAPWRWFVHHAVLNVRRFPLPERRHEPLTPSATRDDLPFVAFVMAIRKLPPQQAEAFILHHGESLDRRPLAIAMDCSTTAAANHLAAAEEQLRLAAAEGYAKQLAKFRQAYDNLSPDPEQVRRYVLANVRRQTLGRRTWRWIKWLTIFVALVAGGWLLRKFWGR